MPANKANERNTNKRTTRYRNTNIHSQLNKSKVRSLKLLERALEGSEVLLTQITAAKVILEVLSHYEPGIQMSETAL